MKAPFLLLALCIFGRVFGQSNLPKSTSPIPVTGVCFDLATAVYLPVEAFASVNNTKVKVGQSNKEGLFSLLLPRSTTSLSFESKGYRTVTLPVQIVGQPSAKAAFRLGIIMGTFDSLPVRQTHQLLLSIDLPDSTDLNYFVGPIGSNAGLPMVQTAHGNRVAPGGYIKFSKAKPWRFTNFEGARPGPYRIFASTPAGRVLVNEDITVEEGLTLMEVRTKEPTEQPAPTLPNGVHNAKNFLPAPRSLYFDQSRYELTAQTKAALDSMAFLLAKQPGIRAKITGYTEDIGERKLNMTLSEYRAKTVANYLKQKGIPDSLMAIDWKGPESAMNAGNKKGNDRRVTVEFSRR